MSVFLKELTYTGRAAFPLAGAAPRAGRLFQLLDRRQAGLDPVLEHARPDPLADADRFEAIDDLLFFFRLMHDLMKSLSYGLP